MFDYIRVACAVPDISVGNTEYNTSCIIDKLDELAEKKADIVVFPEMCITGYTCQDLFLQRQLIDSVKKQLVRLCNVSEKYDFAFTVGAPVEIRGQLFNCAVVILNGKIKGIVPKTFIPNYNEFYERRWFSSSTDLTVNQIMYSDICSEFNNDYSINVGSSMIFDFKKKVKFGIELCEDLWTPLPPSTILSLNGAELILNLSASNETIAKRNYRKGLIQQQSARCICAYAYASAGESESTQDLIFSGHSIISENGSVLCENNKNIDNDYILISDVDIGKIRADRLKNKSFANSMSMHYYQTVNVNIDGKTTDVYGDGTMANVAKCPFVPSGEKDRTERCISIFDMQASALKKRLKITNGKAIIGVSGGLDSTLALLVTVYAMKELGRPVTDVIAVTLPCFGTTDRTYNNALKLMELLGVTSMEVNIRNACTVHCNDIGHDINKLDVTFENVQARERTQILMDIACKEGGFVVGTGDLSELALGWCTYNADHMSMYGVNSSIPKTLIKWMISSVAENDMFSGCSEVLYDIIDTPISPELLPPDENGNITQETESLVGPYILHDFFLYYVLRYGFAPKKIFNLAVNAFSDDYDKTTILKWLKTFYRRFFTQQFKRSCLPDGVKVGSVCLSPRGDWRMPSDASSKIWLDELEKIEI